ncbi:hypothetical protein [Orenia marismortui]|uniref:Uncharacterized protein n=1 Tax=Orenia marismortui TaxID=46469 RepID=A0A4R8GSC3_9FIRM|nr:hypothetical protein [Orenia marismortui]TDX48827.1 hypothetical protein C7959_1256 [Orenia marismortui]
MHQYSVKNHPREKVIFCLAAISIFFAPLLSNLLKNNILKNLNITSSISISAFSVFGLTYFAFNKYIWRWVGKYINYPNLNGQYNVKGTSLKNPTGKEIEWKGTVNIKQNWDKIIITLQTNNSSSKSLSVISGIRHVPTDGYQLSYHYENSPDVSKKELKNHEGFCMLDFEENLNKATGHYFNNIKDRASYGKMVLERIDN